MTPIPLIRTAVCFADNPEVHRIASSTSGGAFFSCSAAQLSESHPLGFRVRMTRGETSMRPESPGTPATATFGPTLTGPPLPWPVRVIMRAALRVRASLQGKR
ncbi:hypothetical protein GCM10008937_29050 [Deinococcus depolymerans]|uniref:Uncharacterized protein n=1 Tax=Deinococcus depolymerans TaxID=392408 RepID=A0ABP3MJ50_9DEIO